MDIESPGGEVESPDGVVESPSGEIESPDGEVESLDGGIECLDTPFRYDDCMDMEIDVFSSVTASGDGVGFYYDLPNFSPTKPVQVERSLKRHHDFITSLSRDDKSRGEHIHTIYRTARWYERDVDLDDKMYDMDSWDCEEGGGEENDRNMEGGNLLDNLVWIF
jgi:hypothetical protein